MKRRKKVSVISRIAALFITVIFALPLYIAVVNAFKPYEDIVMKPLAPPSAFTLQNFVSAWNSAGIPRLYLNSILITGCSLVLLILVASMAAYIVARKNTKFYNGVYVFFLMGLMIPVQMILIPSMKTLAFFHLLRTMPGMILFNCAVYFSVSFFLYVEFFKTLPTSLEESAKIDGASRFVIFRSILLPLLKPCTSTVIIFSGMWIWNDFLPPLYILDAKTGSTITTGIYRAIGQYTTNWDIVFGAVMWASVPVVILYLCMQKQFRHGMVAGAVKG